MAIGITEEHRELHQVVRRWVETHCAPEVARAALEADEETLPAFWPTLAEPGWLGIHVGEEHGGAGFGLPELVVVVEELGRAVAPGPLVPTVLAAAVVESTSNEEARGALLPGLCAGTSIGAVALAGSLRVVTDDRPVGPWGDGDVDHAGRGLVVSGTLPAVLGGCLADVVVAAVGTDDGEVWCALDAAEGTVTAARSLDPTRRVAEIAFDRVAIGADRVLEGVTADTVRAHASVLIAAEAVGVSQWCVDAAARYACERQQFGRPIGQFQGVKHRSAEMLARTELARAAVWDAARAVGHDDNGELIALAAAAALTSDAALQTAKDCVQTFGGIGFTWEHDAHLYLRRATVAHQLLGPASHARRRAAGRALAGERRRLAVELPPEADRHREEVRALLARLEGTSPQEERAILADEGYIVPSWPRPWGRDADALEQLVIDDEFRRAKRRIPNLAVGAWALPTVIVLGTPAQQERWIPPTLRGEISWCQLFSEPGAGSDLASLSTRATRADGGWVLDGQKVWTTMAAQADWGICLARTDPDAERHEGISCFMVEMSSPGIEVRPLRELTGMAMFNEVFFDGAFVPDDCLVGKPGDGWRAARTTLANERVHMGSGNTIRGVVGVMEMVRERGLDGDADVLDVLGDLVVTSHALGVLGHRLTLQALFGADPSGSEASVRKLLGTRHDQRVGEVGLELLGAEALVDEGDGAAWIYQFLFNQCLTIAGGTSDIQKNVIAERLLGLPRDP